MDRIRSLQTQSIFDNSDQQDIIKQQMDLQTKHIETLQFQTEELLRIQKEKATILNIPTSDWDDDTGKNKMNEEVLLNALEKLRDYIQSENKRVRDELLRHHIEVEQKLKEKIDRKELDEIE